MSLDPTPWLMFLPLFGLILLGLPIAFAMLVVSFVFGLYAYGDLVGLQLWGVVVDSARNFTLAAVPLFVLMGFLLAQSGIAERLYRTMQLWCAPLPGGVGVATLAMCGIFAAATGIVGAVEVVVGLMAIPAMMSLRYNRSLIAGTICAGGSLGTVIPPSIIVVVYASTAEMSIGELMAGIIIPGALTLGLFIAYILTRVWLNPSDAPHTADPASGQTSLGELLWTSITSLVPAAVLIAAVLGSILAGVASPTEAAALGVAGAVLLTVAYGRFSVSLLGDALGRTVGVTSMILLIVVGGTMFTGVFLVLGGGQLVLEVVRQLQLTGAEAIILFLAVVFLLGFFFDWVTIVMICVPIFHPILTYLNVNPLWFAVLMIVAMQTSYLTPPMAPSIFYLKSIAPPEITYRDMFIGVMPFVAVQLIILLIVALVPSTATHLPSVLVGF